MDEKTKRAWQSLTSRDVNYFVQNVDVPEEFRTKDAFLRNEEAVTKAFEKFAKKYSKTKWIWEEGNEEKAKK